MGYAIIGVLVQVAACVALIFVARSFGCFTAELAKTRLTYERLIVLEELVLKKLLIAERRRQGHPVQPDHSEDVCA